jgi:hypothetical protein
VEFFEKELGDMASLMTLMQNQEDIVSLSANNKFQF